MGKTTTRQTEDIKRFAKPNRRKRKVGSQRKACWNLFSKYIRQKYAVDGIATCVTCGVKKNWTELHAGHFVDGRNNSVLLDERLVFPQCMNCNVWLHGNKIEYFKFMRTMYTEEELYGFQKLKHEVKKMTNKDWELKLKELKDKYGN